MKDNFGELFKKFRLKAQFSTLPEFGEALAEEGFVYEDSIFSRWQKRNRTPKDRNLLFTLVRIFIKRGGITRLSEANALFESSGQGYLTDSEIKALPKKLLSNAPFQVPSEIAYFTGRETYIKKMTKIIKKQNTVLVYGMAGVGKTALAIKLGHLLRNEFPNGVLWYRLDTSDVTTILSAIAYVFGENIAAIKDVNIRSSVVRSILASKKTLLILDNADLQSKIDLLLPNSSSCSVIITSRYKNLDIQTSHLAVALNFFTQKESLSLFQKILGSKYVKRNRLKLIEVSNLLGNLPLAVNIFAKGLYQSTHRKNIKTLLWQLVKEGIKLDSLTYEDKNLYGVLNLIFKGMDRITRKVFSSLAVFNSDFSLSALSFLHGYTKAQTEKYLQKLIDSSLVEGSLGESFRLHPTVKLFAQQKLHNKKFYLIAANYYKKFLAKGGRANTKFYPTIETELSNIISIFEKCYALRYWEAVIELWEYIGVFLWDVGYWDRVEDLGQKAYKAALWLKNDYARAFCCIRELSWLYYWRGNLLKAEGWAVEGLKVSNKLKNPYLVAFAKQRLGKVYQSKKLLSKAEKLLKESLESFLKLKELERYVDTLTYLGENYTIMGDLKKGEDNLRKALKLTDRIGDINQHAIVFGYLGEIAYLKKNYREAKEYFEQSLLITKVKGLNVGGKVWCNIGLALLNRKLGNYEQVYGLLQKAQGDMVKLGIRYDEGHPLMIEYKQLL